MFGWLRKDTVDRTGGTGLNSVDGAQQHLALYKYDSCPFCRRVHSVIDGLDVNIEYRDVHASREWRQDLISRTGRTQVPCLVVDDKPLFESADIAAFLRATFPAAR